MSGTVSSIVAETGSSITTAGSRSDIVYLPEPEVLITSNPMGERFIAISLSVCLSVCLSVRPRISRTTRPFVFAQNEEVRTDWTKCKYVSV